MANNFFQENDLWQAIQAQADVKKQRRQLVEMARLLLKRANLSPNEIAQLDYDDLTDLLLEYQDIAEQTESFFQNALPHIDPEYQGQPFEQQLQTLQQTLSDTRANIVRLREQQQTLSEQQARLETEQITLDKEIQRLNQIKPQLEQLEQNILRLKEQLETLKQHEAQLKQLAEDSEPFQQQVITAIIEAIPNMVALIKANQEIFRNHLTENARIAEAMQQIEEKTSEIAAHTDNIATLSKNIDASLQEFDAELQQLIQIQEKLSVH
jgi:DNA repair exonuclease SbcCD ATPase subunit